MKRNFIVERIKKSSSVITYPNEDIVQTITHIGMYYSKNLNCLLYLFKENDKKEMMFTSSTYVSDLFTSTMQFKGQVANLVLYGLTEITENNWKKYIDSENNVRSPRVKDNKNSLEDSFIKNSRFTLSKNYINIKYFRGKYDFIK